MSSPLYSLLADRIENRNCKGSVVTETLPTHPLYSNCIPLLFYRCFRCIETGAILLLTADPIVAWKTCLVNPLQHSGFQAARHNIFSLLPALFYSISHLSPFYLIFSPFFVITSSSYVLFYLLLLLLPLLLFRRTDFSLGCTQFESR
jgi:hypothetical protein